MSIAAKTVLLKDLETRLGKFLTAEMLGTVMPEIGECFTAYDVTQIAEPNRNEDLLEAFLSAKEVEGRSHSTTERYVYILRRFLSETNTDTHRVTVYHIRAYLMSEKRRGISDLTLEGYRSVFSSYFGWLHNEGLIPANPCANLGTIKCPKIIREPYSAEDLERLREACKTLRDRVILEFLLSTGCRISEVCALNRDDIDFLAMECVVTGKGNKQRIVYLNAVATMLLKRYLSQRHDENPALFVGKGAERLLPGGVRVMLKKLEDRSGVTNVHPHRFRRTLATHLIARGMAIQECAAILGHEKLDTSMRYVYLDKTTVKNSYRKFA